MLHVTGLGVDLAELLLAHARNAPKGIKEHSTGAGGALVNGEDVFADCHSITACSIV